jgi:hypothetical protein
LDNLLSGNPESTIQQCIDKCAALCDFNFVLYNYLTGGGGSAVCSTYVWSPTSLAVRTLTLLGSNNDDYSCADDGTPRSAVAIYDKIAAATAPVLG